MNGLRVGRIHLGIFVLVIQAEFLADTETVFVERHHLAEQGGAFLLVHFAGEGVVHQVVEEVFFRSRRIVPAGLCLRLDVVAQGFFQVDDLLVHGLRFHVFLAEGARLVAADNLAVLQVAQHFQDDRTCLIGTQVGQ